MTLGLLVASENVDRHTYTQDSCFIGIDYNIGVSRPDNLCILPRSSPSHKAVCHSRTYTDNLTLLSQPNLDQVS